MKTMSYAQIFVQAGPEPFASRSVQIAADLARRQEASLVGVYLEPPLPSAFQTGLDAPLPQSTVDALIAQHQAEAGKAARHAREAFERAAAGEGVPAEWRVIGGTFNDLVRTARTADLLVVPGPPKHGADGILIAPVDTLVLSSGGPVLVVPDLGAGTAVGARIVVAWNGSREAARAMRDALPLLKQAQAVTAVVVGHGDETADAESTLVTYFERHGCAGSVTRLPVFEERPREVLLRHAAQIEADLIVMGLYGHSRLQEFVLGGMSRDMLEGSPFPMLLSH